MGGDITDAANPGGTGTLNISNGGLVTSSAGSIGDSQNAVGSVTIDNAAWNISGRLGVGNFGKGTLTVQNGGTLTSTGGLVGLAEQQHQQLGAGDGHRLHLDHEAATSTWATKARAP